MSETTNGVEAPPEPKSQAEDTSAHDFSPITSQAELNRVIENRLERERRKYADYAELKAKASKFEEFEEASKSEQQKLAERAQKAEAELAKLQAAAQLTEWKAQVSEATGVPAKVLAGSTLEELTAHGEQLAQLLGSKAPASQRTIVPSGAESEALALNGDGLENSLKRALGIV
ncbi:hypothetical protein [Rothia sp. CCM 9416]|uniref:hypothetical protein n=1 Tax=Rothia sp. CCM 9416 TaxID=3402655 RepID=UPI003AE6A93F